MTNTNTILYFNTIQDLLFICVDQTNSEFADYSCHYFGPNGNTVPRFLAHFWSRIIIFLVSHWSTGALGHTYQNCFSLFQHYWGTWICSAWLWTSPHACIYHWLVRERLNKKNIKIWWEIIKKILQLFRNFIYRF